MIRIICDTEQECKKMKKVLFEGDIYDCPWNDKCSFDSCKDCIDKSIKWEVKN